MKKTERFWSGSSIFATCCERLHICKHNPFGSEFLRNRRLFAWCFMKGPGCDAQVFPAFLRVLQSSGQASVSCLPHPDLCLPSSRPNRQGRLPDLQCIPVPAALRLLQTADLLQAARSLRYKEPAKTPQLAAGMKAGFSFLDICV